MRRFLRKHNGIACALVAAVLISCISIGFSGRAPETSVSVIASGLPATTPVSQLKYTTVSSYIMITGYTGTSASLVLPASIDGKPVKRIADKAFYRNKTITYVYLPAGVTTIGARAFGECDSLIKFEVDTSNTALKAINGILYSKDLTVLKVFPGGLSGAFTVPKTVKKIDAYAFYYCYQVTRIQMYNAVTEIGDAAFAFCWNMTHIRLSDTLKKLGKLMFYGCESLSYIYLPKSLTAIADSALLGFIDSSGNKTYHFVDGIDCVNGSYAFNYVKSLRLTPTAASDRRYEPDADVGVYCPSFDNGVAVSAAVVTGGDDYTQAASLVSGEHYYKFKVYQLSASKDGAAYTLPANTAVQFGVGAPFSYPYALKVYLLKDGALVPMPASVSYAHGEYALTVSGNTSGTFVVAEYFDLIKGDVDGNGEVQTLDARLALMAAAHIIVLNDDQIQAADFNGNDKVDVSEARIILRYVAKIDPLPV